MRTKIVIGVAAIVLALILVTGACSAGFVAARMLGPGSPGTAIQLPDLPSQIDSGGEDATPQDLETLFKPFWQAWDLVHEYYVDQPVDDVALMRGAIRGMLESLEDEHTSYLDPTAFEQSEAHLRGEEYEGIGAWVDITGDYLTIISPMPGSPAEDAGLRPEDIVIAVDGKDMTGVDGELVRQQIIGPEGTEVKLTIRREGVEEPIDVVVKRASIVVPSVDYRILEGTNIAYVRLFTFGEETTGDLRTALERVLAENPDGLILDLRYNGGGYLETAIDVASEFIGDGVIMYEEYGDGSMETYDARNGGLATEIPMAVLINEGSASASEIVAGAIQDRDRGILVGVTSFGKGSVQNYTPLVNDQGAVRVTVARWLTPDKRQINQVGLEPDITVEFTEDDIAAGADPQLERAVEALTQQ